MTQGHKLNANHPALYLPAFLSVRQNASATRENYK